MALHPLAPARTTEVYDHFWRFAAERQEMFFNRIKGRSPLTNDPILQKHRFTNTYRASDRVSQYLIREVIYNDKWDAEDLFFRIILFKTFNRIDTWRHLERRFGRIDYSSFSFEKYSNFLSELFKNGVRLYSPAYIMASGKEAYGYARKHSNHLRVIEQMMKDNAVARIQACSSMQDVFELLRSYPTIGNFLAYQYAIDINYSPLTHFSEMDFVVPGPGATDGIRKCFSDLGGLSEIEIIRLVAEKQASEFQRLGISFMSLWGRPLQLIDCQNVFCELSKYARVKFPDVVGASGRTRIKQVYSPTSEPIQYWYPPKWGINKAVASDLRKTSRSGSTVAQ